MKDFFSKIDFDKIKPVVNPIIKAKRCVRKLSNPRISDSAQKIIRYTNSPLCRTFLLKFFNAEIIPINPKIPPEAPTDMLSGKIKHIITAFITAII